MSVWPEIKKALNSNPSGKPLNELIAELGKRIEIFQENGTYTPKGNCIAVTACAAGGDGGSGLPTTGISWAFVGGGGSGGSAGQYIINGLIVVIPNIPIDIIVGQGNTVLIQNGNPILTLIKGGVSSLSYEIIPGNLSYRPIFSGGGGGGRDSNGRIAFGGTSGGGGPKGGAGGTVRAATINYGGGGGGGGGALAIEEFSRLSLILLGISDIRGGAGGVGGTPSSNASFRDGTPGTNGIGFGCGGGGGGGGSTDNYIGASAVGGLGAPGVVMIVE